MRLPTGDQEAGFIILDGIRMLCEKMSTLILHFNYSIYIILLLEINKSIIIALEIMNLNILLVNFLKCIIGEYVGLNHARSVLDVKCPHWRIERVQDWKIVKMCW